MIGGNCDLFGIPEKVTICDLFGILLSGGVIVTFSGFIFQFFSKSSQINSKSHLSTLNHIFCFGTGLQVDSNSGEGCAGFSEKAFATYAKPK